MSNFGSEVLNPNTTRQPENVVDLSQTEEQEEDDWISITLSADGNKVTSYIGTSSKLDITIVNKTKNILDCQSELTDRQGHDSMDRFILLPYCRHCEQIELTPQKIGDTQIEIKVVANMVNKEGNMKEVTKTSYLTLCGLEPKISVTSDTSPTSPILLNYGFLPESCHQTHTLSVKNLSNFDIPLLFTIKKQSNNLQMFSLVETSNDSINCSKLEKNTSASCILHTGQTLQIAVVFISPEINLLKNENGKAEVRALLDIVVAESDNVILKEIALIGKVASDGIISEPVVTPCKCKAKLKFPKLTTTHKQLVWGSVCVGKQKTKSCMLCNESNSTVKLQASLDDEFNSFKLINDQGQSFNELDIILYPMKCVKLNVAFNPPKIGSAIARVIIKKVSSRGSSNFVLPLHGYGGHVKVAVKGVSKDITGRMGLLDSENSDMCSEFIFSNTGTLDAFAIIKVIPKDPEVTESDFAINSPYLVIGAGASVSVKIDFHLQREVYKILTLDEEDVIEIGVLKIITGDEPSRQIIRRILNSAKNSYLEDKLKNSHMPQLCKIFPGEVTLGELEFQNDPDYIIIRMLNQSFTCQEISLTVEKNLDKSYFAKSMMVECGAEGNGQMFTSLYSETIHNAASTHFTMSHARKTNHLWNISPTVINLRPPFTVHAELMITNKFQTSQSFKAQVSNHYLQVVPSSGTIQPNEVITVSCSPSFKTRERELQSVIRIYIENDVKEIKVHIKYQNKLTE